MEKQTRFPKIFFGWWIVLTAGFISLWGFGYQTVGFSALLKPIASELGFNRAVTSVAPSIGKLEGGLEAPLTGWFTDKFGARWIVISGILLMTLSLVLMNFINSLGSFYLVWGVMFGTGFNMSVTLPLLTTISNWFVKKRGLAMGILTVLSSLSSVVVLPFIAWLITTQGWRMTCVVGGLVMSFVGLPLAWFFIKRHRPEYYGLLPDGAISQDETEAGPMIERGIKYAGEVHEVEFTLREAMKTPAYWMLIAVYGILGLASPVINVHGIPFLTDIGIEPLRAAGMVAIIAVAGTPARLAIGFFADRIDRERLRFLVAGALLSTGIGLTIFLLNQTTIMIYVWFILWGLGDGAALTVNGAVRARYFGRKAFGSITGSTTMFLTPFLVASPIYLGWIYDTTGSYITGFKVIVALLALATVIACFIPSPKMPVQANDIDRFI